MCRALLIAVSFARIWIASLADLRRFSQIREELEGGTGNRALDDLLISVIVAGRAKAVCQTMGKENVLNGRNDYRGRPAEHDDPVNG